MGQPQNLELAPGNFPVLALYIRNEWLNLEMLPSYYAFKTSVAFIKVFKTQSTKLHVLLKKKKL